MDNKPCYDFGTPVMVYGQRGTIVEVSYHSLEAAVKLDCPEDFVIDLRPISINISLHNKSPFVPNREYWVKVPFHHLEFINEDSPKLTLSQWFKKLFKKKKRLPVLDIDALMRDCYYPLLKQTD